MLDASSLQLRWLVQKMKKHDDWNQRVLQYRTKIDSINAGDKGWGPWTDVPIERED